MGIGSCNLGGWDMWLSGACKLQIQESWWYNAVKVQRHEKQDSHVQGHKNGHCILRVRYNTHFLPLCRLSVLLVPSMDWVMSPSITLVRLIFLIQSNELKWSSVLETSSQLYSEIMFYQLSGQIFNHSSWYMNHHSNS